MRRTRAFTALLLAAVLLAGTVPARAAEPSEDPFGTAILEEDGDREEIQGEEPEEIPVETPEETPEENPGETQAAPQDGTGDGKTVIVTNSNEFRAALANSAVDTILFSGSVRVEKIGIEEDSAGDHLRAELKTIRPVDNDYVNNSLSFEPGVTLLQISPHEGNSAQPVQDQSISLIYGTAENGRGENVPDLDRLTGLVPGTVGWYEYHAKKEENPTDEYAGMRVCYTLYCGDKADAVQRAAELTSGHWEYELTNTGNDYRLVFTIFGTETALSEVIETDMFYVLQGCSLTVDSNAQLRVRDYLEVEGRVFVQSGGTLDASDWDGTEIGDGLGGKPYLNIWEDLVVEPGGAISFGSNGGYVGWSVILGQWVPKPDTLEYGGDFIPCLAAKWDENDYSTGISMLPTDALNVTFALCAYNGGDPGTHENFCYTELAGEELTAGNFALPSFLKYSKEESTGVWTLTAENASMGERGEITYTKYPGTATEECYTLPVLIEKAELSGLPDLGCYRESSASQTGLIKEEKWCFDPLVSDNTFYVCVREDSRLMSDSNWNLETNLAVTARWDDSTKDIPETEVPNYVTTKLIEKGVWQVTVTHPALQVEFRVQPSTASPENGPGTGIWVEAPEWLVYSEAPLNGDSPNDDTNNPDRVLTFGEDGNAKQLQGKLVLTKDGSADVVLYQLVYDWKGTPEASRWVCEYVPWNWTQSWDGVHLSRVSESGRELYTRVTDEGIGEWGEIYRLHGKGDEPDYGNTRGEPLVVVTDQASAEGPRLVVRWGGGDYGEDITMTPRDEYEVSFALRAWDEEKGEVVYTALSGEALTFPEPLLYENRQEEGASTDRWVLTAEGAELGQRYQITYAAESGEKYTLPVRIELPDLGFYSEPIVDLEHYLTNWQYTPLNGTFYACVRPEAWFAGNADWNMSINPTVTAWRDGKDAGGNPTRTEVSGAVSCTTYIGSSEGAWHVWEITASDFRVVVEFQTSLSWTGTETQKPDEKIEAGLWIDAGEQLVYSTAGVLEGDSPYNDSNETLDRVLTETIKDQLSNALPLSPGASADVVLYLLRYDDGKGPDIHTSGWVCEQVSGDRIQGRDGVILSQVPGEGEDVYAYTRVTLRVGCGEWPCIVRLGDRWVEDEMESGGGHWEPDHSYIRGILPIQVTNGEGPFLMVDWGGGNYSGTIEMTPYDEPEVSFVLCQYDKERGEYVPVPGTGPLAPEDISVPYPLIYEPMESHGNKQTLRTDEHQDRNSMWGQIYEIVYTEGDASSTDSKPYSLPVLMTLPELGCYREPKADPWCYLHELLYNPLREDANTFYVCADPDAWFMGDENWKLPGTITAQCVRYDENGNEIPVTGGVQVEPARDEAAGGTIPGAWRVTVTVPDVRVELRMELVWAGPDSEKQDAPVIWGGIWAEAAQRLVYSESVLTDGSPLDPNDSNDPSRTLTEANRSRLHDKLELKANTTRDVVLYLLVYDETKGWTCEHTSLEWAEGLDGVSLAEAEDGLFTRVIASWGGESRIVRLDGQQTGENDYRPIRGTQRGEPLYVSVTGGSGGLRLMAKWPDGNCEPDITMTPLDKYEVDFVLVSGDTASSEIPVSRKDLDCGPLTYDQWTEVGTDGQTIAHWVLSAENADWNRTYTITYTADGKTYALPVRVEQPDLACYSKPEPTRENLLREAPFNPLAEANEFYVCVRPGSGLIWDGIWNLSGELTVNSGDMSGFVKTENLREGVWRVAVTEAAFYVDLRMKPIDESNTGYPPGTGLWIEPAQRLAFSDGILEGAPYQNNDSLDQVLTDNNRGQLQETLTLNTGAHRDVALYLLVYHDGSETEHPRGWVCKHNGFDPAKIQGDGVELKASPDREHLIRVTADTENNDARILRLDENGASEGKIRGSLPVTVSSSTPKKEMAVKNEAGEAVVEVARTGENSGRTVTISSPTGSLSQQSPLYAAGYDAEGRLVSIRAFTSGGSISFPKNVAWYRLIWADQKSAPRCESIYEYLGVN